MTLAKTLQLALAALALTLAGLAPTASAQTFPNRPMRIVVTYPPGGAPDILARQLAAKMQESWGQPVIVENRPGAGGNIGTEYVAKSAPDGYTLVLATVNTHAINAGLYPNLNFDPIKDFAPVAMLVSTPNLLVLNVNVPATNIRELIALAKSKPGQLFFASSGSGSSIHISGELFNVMAGVKMVHVPYKGRAGAIPDLLAGHVHMMFDNMPSALPLAKEGKLRGIAVTTAKRSPAAPDIPTIAESGLPGFDVTPWFAVFAPAGVPKDIIAKLNAEVNRILALPDVKERLSTLGMDIIGGTPEYLGNVQREDLAKWGKLVRDSGAKPD